MDVYIRPARKKNGDRYYEYILAYVDDILSISETPEVSQGSLRSVFKLKNNKIAIPDMYLGMSLKHRSVVAGTGKEKCWSLCSDKYVSAAIKNVKDMRRKKDKSATLPKKCVTPFVSNYHPNEDVSDELDSDGIRDFQALIGILRWATKLGRLDVLLETALLSQHLASPRIGHLEQAYHIFGYLDQKSKRSLYMDPTHPNIAEQTFTQYDWGEFYCGVEEPIPSNAPEALGKAVSTHCFVDANHAGDKTTRRSQTGILIFINMAPIMWFSKKQNAVETSTFGSEFTAMRTAVEMIRGLRYKLRMFGVPIEGPTNIFTDNEAVFKNASIPHSVLSKKQHSISYHMCREAVADSTIRVGKEDTETNLADPFTKVMVAPKREPIFDRYMY